MPLADYYRRKLKDFVILCNYQYASLIKVDDPQIYVSEHKYIDIPYAAVLNLNLNSNVKDQYNKM